MILLNRTAGLDSSSHDQPTRIPL